MQLSEEEKQALKEKYKEQRQEMWAGKRAPSHDSEEGTEEESDDPSEAKVSSHEATEAVTQPDDTVLSDSQVDPSPTETAHETSHHPREEAIQEESSVQPDPREAGQVPASNLPQGSVNSEGEAEFWEESEKEGEPGVLTWKLTLGVVGAVIVLIGVGVLLGYWFAS